MISYYYKTDFRIDNEETFSNWISNSIEEEGFELGDISFTFCTDEELHKINLQYLEHDTYTDIISFDYSVGKILQGEIFISVDRVEENSKEFSVAFVTELSRVIIHGVLHYCGYKDKSEDDTAIMRKMEDYYMSKLM